MDRKKKGKAQAEPSIEEHVLCGTESHRFVIASIEVYLPDMLPPEVLNAIAPRTRSLATDITECLMRHLFQ